MNSASLARLMLLAAIWGASFLFMRIAAPALGAIPTAFGRVLLGALGLVVIVFALRVPHQYRGLFLVTLFLGVINSGIPFLMFSLAARSLPAGYSAILNATTPLMGVLVGVLFFREPATATKLLGVAFGLAGVWVLTRTGPLLLDQQVLLGVVACLVATSCYALAGFLTKRWISARGGLDSKLVALGSQMGAVLFLLPIFVWQMTNAEGTQINQHIEHWQTLSLAMLALGLVCTSLAYVLYFQLIADIGPLKALSVTFLIPLFGVLWGAVFLHETLSTAHLVGGTLIALALFLVLRPQISS